MKADLAIRGATIVTEHAVMPADVAVVAGKIAAILAPDTAVEAADTLQARGLHLLPGLVDCHVHLNEPGRTHWEGYATGTSAAAAGGITTVLDMPLNNDPPTLDRAALRIKRDAVASHAVVDYGHWGGYIGGNLENLNELHQDGVVAFKAFMSPSGLDEFPAVDDAALFRGLRRLASLGAVLGVHAESAGLTTLLGTEEQAAQHREPQAWARSRPGFTEEEAVQRALLLARETGCRLHVVHASTAVAATLVSSAAAGGVRATVETCPHYLTLDEDDLERTGAVAKCAPPLRSRAVVDELWSAVLDGRIDCIASDHSPCSPEVKHQGEGDIWCAWGGIAGIQTLLPALLTEGVHKRGLPLSRLVHLTSANPARLFGLFPRKGALQVGADADFTLIDLKRQWTLEAGMLHNRWSLSPFIGRQFHGSVAATIVRGMVVYREGQVLATPGAGRLLVPIRED
ncbi:MAG TPA: allantoinase AllB [Chloroflexota bacterium]|nr:allantoinase AllB [Chloroflexota bacterium]